MCYHVSTMKTPIHTVLLVFLLSACGSRVSRGAERETGAGDHAPPPKPRVALVASGDEKAAGLVELTAVELSGRDDIVLLERAEIGKLLAEHKLRLDGLLSTADALKIGQLLKCDIFAELHYDAASRNNAEVTSLVVFDALTGVRLHDGAVKANKDLERHARAAAKALAAGLRKWQGGRSVPDCRILSFVSVRQLYLPDLPVHIGKSAGLLIERRLINTPDIAILERKRLELINKEKTLTDLRHECLLAASVLVDLDMTPGRAEGSLRIRAQLTDGAGNELGTSEASGNATAIDRIVTALCRDMAARLKLTPLSELTVAPGFEANRFLADTVRLELRGRRNEAAVSEAAALALTEAALDRAPENIAVQKLNCRLIQRTVARDESISQRLLDLRRHLDLCEHWPCAADTQWFIEGFADLLHSCLRADASNAKAKWVRNMRRRFAAWCRRACEQDPELALDVRCIEAGAVDAQALLEGCRDCLRELPGELGIRRYSALADYHPLADSAYVYPLDSFSARQKRQLLGLYKAWGEAGRERIDLFNRMQSHICAAMLVRAFPDDFPGHDRAAGDLVSRAADLVLNDPTLTGPFLQLCTGRGHRPPAFYNGLAPATIVPAVRRLAQELDAKRRACPLLLKYLDEHDDDGAEYPGHYLRKAWAQLDSPEYTSPSGDVRRPRFPEWYVEDVRNTYKARYGGDVAREKPPEIGPAEMESQERLFEFEGVPGLASIESAELDGEWLYLLCCRRVPSTYDARRVNVRTAETQSLGEIETDLAFRARTGNELVIGTDAVHVPTSGGLLSFPLDGRKVRTLTTANGLPASRVTACVEAAGKLYLGCRGGEEGYVVRCDPDGKAVELLACSGRKERLSDLDDCPPYTIESIVHDEPRARLFIVAMCIEEGAKSRPWLWTYDLKSGRFSKVHDRPYHPLQLRPMSDGRFVLHVADMHHTRSIDRRLPGGKKVTVTVRVPSAQGARGYALWDPAAYTNSPLDDLTAHVTPLIGNTDPEKLRVRYHVPTFWGRYHVMPGTAGSMALLTGKCLVSSGVRRTPVALDSPGERFMMTAQAGFDKPWQLIPRGDVGGEVKNLPLLDDEAPFVVRAYGDNKIVACTQAGVWLLKPKLPSASGSVAEDAAASGDNALATEPHELAAGTPAGRLVVAAPLGATARVDGEEAYRVWNEGVLKWNRLAAGRHTVDVEFLGKKQPFAVEIHDGRIERVAATFGREHTRTRKLQLGGGCEMELVWIPEHAADARVDARRRIYEGFWMGKYEVTQEQYERVVGANPSATRGRQHPVDSISWDAATDFCRRLTKQCANELNGWIVRLPSNLEFAYACAAGATTAYYSGDTKEDLLRAGWYPENCTGATHPVGGKMPNAFWLHDLYGNVAERTERGGLLGGAWQSHSRSTADGAGFRLVIATPDTQRRREADGWTYLAYLNPVSARVGYGGFVAYKKRDEKFAIAGPVTHSFKTLMSAHAVSSVKYRLGGKFSELEAHYSVHENSGGVARFGVYCDGKQTFRGRRIWPHGGTQWYGVKTPIRLDVSGVDVLELVTYGDDNGSIAGSSAYWLDPKVR